MTATAPLRAAGISTAQPKASKLFAALELSKAKWLICVDAPGSDKRSTHVVDGGDSAALLDLLVRLRAAAERRVGEPVQVVVIQEAGLDGFWIHRLLEQNGIESHVVDAASIAVNRRHRRAKTDAIDGEALLRTLLAWARGERRVCSMVRPPSPEEEDRRRLTRERGTLLKERTQQTNRVRGLLFGQGITDHDPLRQDRLIPNPDDPHSLAPLHVAERQGQPGRWRTLQPDLVLQLGRGGRNRLVMSGDSTVISKKEDDIGWDFSVASTLISTPA
jgi:transposase